MKFLVQLRQRRVMPADLTGYSDLKDRVCRTLETLGAHPGVHGGVPIGGRALLFVIEVADQPALDAFLQDLPVWDVMDDIDVTALVGFTERLAYNRGPSPSDEQE